MSWGNVGGTVACESALRSAGTLLSRVRAPPSATRPDGGPKSLRSPCCGLAIYKNPILYVMTDSSINIVRLRSPLEPDSISQQSRSLIPLR
ncbi:hypothetical protein PoB_003405900 [Plakobranchus ocellatus]|uniref:Uncharacterized protein n=1 Tax=Plakobranchus ocellatus TaxID=259542 RepID=A0AAV4AMG3_9GAST|nr:hypothetical protein PoB_003405900 [Plakobranchus ocellatus]